MGQQRQGRSVRLVGAYEGGGGGRGGRKLGSQARWWWRVEKRRISRYRRVSRASGRNPRRDGRWFGRGWRSCSSAPCSSPSCPVGPSLHRPPPSRPRRPSPAVRTPGGSLPPASHLSLIRCRRRARSPLSIGHRRELAGRAKPRHREQLRTANREPRTANATRSLKTFSSTARASSSSPTLASRARSASPCARTRTRYERRPPSTPIPRAPPQRHPNAVRASAALVLFRLCAPYMHEVHDPRERDRRRSIAPPPPPHPNAVRARAALGCRSMAPPPAIPTRLAARVVGRGRGARCARRGVASRSTRERSSARSDARHASWRGSLLSHASSRRRRVLASRRARW